MSDKLKQVGKSMRQTKEDSRSALRRYSENFPKIERVRDSFATGQEFRMYFKTKRDDNRITLDLVFLQPFCSDCEPPDPDQ